MTNKKGGIEAQIPFGNDKQKSGMTNKKGGIEAQIPFGNDNKKKTASRHGAL